MNFASIVTFIGVCATGALASQCNSCIVNSNYQPNTTTPEWCNTNCYYPDGSPRNHQGVNNQCQFDNIGENKPCIDCSTWNCNGTLPLDTTLTISAADRKKEYCLTYKTNPHYHKLHAAKCKSNPRRQQKWAIVAGEYPYYTIRPQKNSKKCVYFTSGTEYGLQKCESGDMNQQFGITYEDGSLVQIESMGNRGYCMYSDPQTSNYNHQFGIQICGGWYWALNTL
eukprot:Pgem_evm1s18506